MAEKIVMKNGQLQISDSPIIPFVKGMVLNMISGMPEKESLIKQ